MESKEASNQADLESNLKADDDLTNNIISSFAWHKVCLATASRTSDQTSTSILDEISGHAVAGIVLFFTSRQLYTYLL